MITRYNNFKKEYSKTFNEKKNNKSSNLLKESTSFLMKRHLTFGEILNRCSKSNNMFMMFSKNPNEERAETIVVRNEQYDPKKEYAIVYAGDYYTWLDINTDGEVVGFEIFGDRNKMAKAVDVLYDILGDFFSEEENPDDYESLWRINNATEEDDFMQTSNDLAGEQTYTSYNTDTIEAPKDDFMPSINTDKSLTAKLAKNAARNMNESKKDKKKVSHMSFEEGRILNGILPKAKIECSTDTNCYKMNVVLNKALADKEYETLKKEIKKTLGKKLIEIYTEETGLNFMVFIKV